MRVHIATDHAAFEVKQYLVQELGALGYEIIDHGAHSYDANDDYPDFCIPCAEAVVRDPGSLGIVLGGSGNGEQMAANKVRGIRAAQAHDTFSAERASRSNDAQILTMGARVIGPELAKKIVDTWLSSTFDGGGSQPKVVRIAAYEKEGR